MNLRGQVFELDSSGKAGADGMPATLTIRGVTPQGDAGETFTVAGGKASWKSPVDAGSAAYATPAFYSTQGGPIDMTAWLLERLLASPDHTHDAAARRQGARREANYSRRGRGRGEARR